MIRRQASNTPTPSLVNSAQNEHFNVTEAIRTDAAITSIKSVAKSINFENADDGSYVIRKPLVLKERLDGLSSWYLYDGECILHIENGLLYIGPDTNTVSLRYYDKHLTLREKPGVEYLGIPYVKKVLKVFNAPDHTLVGVILDTDAFSDATGDDLVYPDTHYGVRNAHEVYRFIRIYKDIDTETDSDWIAEVVHPEFNSITSGMDVGNPNTLDVNLLLDNPYAVRDLYGYGYNSVTKILAYVPLQYSASDIGNLPIYALTEDVPYIHNGMQKGFKVLVSSNPIDIYGKSIVLKACITTALTNLKCYCCWEQSANGIDWEVCPEFIRKFQESTDNTLSDRLVSDITSADFEKIAYDDSLEKAATYLVTKKMVYLNPNAFSQTELSESDLIKDRPDVLVLENPNMNLYYRFSIYVDTGKAAPLPEKISKTLSKSYFDSVGNEATDLDDKGKFTYQTFLGNGKDTESSPTPSPHLPELENGSILLYESNDASKVGNYIKVSCSEPTYSIKSIGITLDNRTFHAADDDHEESYYTEDGTYIRFYASETDASVDDSSNIGTTSGLIGANETYSETIQNPAERHWTFANNSKYKESLITDGLFQHRVKIKSIEVKYEVDSNTQTTSTYLTSQTGMFQIPYSKSTEFLEDVSLNRKELFNSDIYYSKEQFLFYGSPNLYVTDLGSSIIRLMNVSTFGSDVTAVISYRNYVLAFTDRTISLLRYDSESGAYNSKLLSSSIGVPKVDSRTITVILNSIYFKSGFRIYRLIPNLYAASDDILNIHTVSGPIDGLLDGLLSVNKEIGNFTYADADNYMLFIPTGSMDSDKSITYMFKYNFVRKLWTLHQYPVLATGVEVASVKEAYLKTANSIYYFKDDLNILLNTTLLQDFSEVGYHDGGSTVTVGGTYSLMNGDDVLCSMAYGNSVYTTLADIYDYIPYGDFLNISLAELYVDVNDKTKQAYDLFAEYVHPIGFLLDFGQKSSNYTVDKQFLETKMLFATLHMKDTFPIELTITTDGIQRELHWDVNTDSALWKESLMHIGTASTGFGTDNQDYDGILRQLIVKYSGKGKTIRHLISGTTKIRFKFYSMDVRSRILPVKQ